MEFNDTTNETGLCQAVDFEVTSNTTSYPLKDKARNANRALDEAITLILGADGRWQYDDTNQTDLPIGTTNLVSSQQDYGISTEMLVITRVEVKDSNGNWQPLNPMDQNDLRQSYFSANADRIPGGMYVQGQSLTDFLNTPGTPLYYDKIGNSIFLYPKPNYNSTAGLKVYYQRKPSYFVYTDTTKKAGFALHLHKYLVFSMALDYARAKKLAQKKNDLEKEVAKWADKITEFYTYRPKDEPVLLKPHIENYK